MTDKGLYQQLLTARQNGQKQLAVLVDPDKTSGEGLSKTLSIANQCEVDYLFVGGSLMTSTKLEAVIAQAKAETEIPVIIFPGSQQQICNKADGILLLSLISGRNPELLIGQHVTAAPALKESGLEIIATGYILVEGGVSTTVSYISNTSPIPGHKPEIAAATALAGAMLGMKTIYLDAGSGALSPVSDEMITAVRNQIDVPLIVGGGIRKPETAQAACKAGADLLVIGNAIEQDQGLIAEMASAIHEPLGVSSPIKIG